MTLMEKAKTVASALEVLNTVDRQLWEAVGDEDPMVQRVREAIVEGEKWMGWAYTQTDIRPLAEGEECYHCGSTTAKVVCDHRGRQIECVFCHLKYLEGRISAVEDKLAGE